MAVLRAEVGVLQNLPGVKSTAWKVEFSSWLRLLLRVLPAEQEEADGEGGQQQQQAQDTRTCAINTCMLVLQLLTVPMKPRMTAVLAAEESPARRSALLVAAVQLQLQPAAWQHCKPQYNSHHCTVTPVVG